FCGALTSSIYTRSLHDALPIFGWGTCDLTAAIRSRVCGRWGKWKNFYAMASPFSFFRKGRSPEETACGRSSSARSRQPWPRLPRSEEHTSELQSPYDLVCRLLL